VNPSPKHAPESALIQSAAAELDAVYGKIARRLIPFLALLFVMAWLDRYNVGFAKLQMAKDLGFSEAVYGFGAGIVYLGYMLFEIPSNLLLERIGGRKTFARITILWGMTSIATVLVKTAGWFYVVRFLLGSFEAGLFPGAVFYLTYWFPARRRALMLALFTTSIPITGIVGGPLSGWIMSAMGGLWNLANWQWLFVLEGVPSIVVGVVTLMIMVDKPSQARWLTDREKQLVLADLEGDRRQAGPRRHGFSEAMKAPRIWLLTAVYFCSSSGVTTVAFWLPTIIQGLGVKSAFAIGLLSAVPYIGFIITMLLVGRHSDRTLERRYHAAVPWLVCAAGLIGTAVFANSPALGFACLVIAVSAPQAGQVAFWQIPPMLLAGTAAATGIALINSVGNLSGWLGASVVGWLADVTGKTTTGLYVVAGLEVFGATLILLFAPRRPVAGERTEAN
jgi:MFS family permease